MTSRRWVPAVVVALAATMLTPAAASADDPFGPGLSDLAISTTGFGMVTTTGIGSLLDSSFTLADLDPVTGALMGPDLSGALTAEYAMITDLSSSTLMALDTADLARDSLAQAQAARAAMEARPSGDVSPDGCPTVAPANTLREGSANLGVYELCANSVAGAVNAQAAVAIKFQLNNLGVPYSQPNRMKDGYFDCSSLAMRSYQAAGVNVLNRGWAPSTANIRASSWAVPIRPRDALPGDLTFPGPGHVATVLSDGFMVHTNRPGDVSHVKRAYRDPYLVLRVDVAALT